MSARDYWNRILVYFGITDENEIDQTARPARPARRADTGEWDAEPEPRPVRRSRATAPKQVRPLKGSSNSGVGVVPPKTFNDAQAIADHFKRGVPVIVNLQQTDTELAKRVIDFASGLTYGLDGSMQRIADKVFLLTPENVDVSAEDRAAMLESGFFNQL